MKLYSVVVIETVSVQYPAVEIEAESEQEAREIAEEMRCQGELGDPRQHESVDEISFEVREEKPAVIA